MNNYQVPLLLSLLAGLSTILGGLIIYIKFKEVGHIITLFLSVSFCVLMCISLFELIPESIPIIIRKYGIIFGSLISINVFIIGYLFVYLIENKIKEKNSSLYKIGVISMISMIIHNFPEGLAVFISAYKDIRIGINMFIAILIHNIIEGTIIAIPLYYSGESRGSVMFKTLLSGLAEPLGALLSYLFLKDIISDLILSYVLLFVSGLMISLSINGILKELLNKNKLKNIVKIG